MQRALSFRGFGFVLLSGALVACGSSSESTMMMTLDTNALVTLPAGTADAMGSDVMLMASTLTPSTGGHNHGAAATAFEALAAGFEYRGWAGSATELTDFGTFTPGTDLTKPAASATRAVISIEQTGAVGAAPSAQVMVAGAVGGKLAFGSVTALALSAAHVEALMGKDWVELSYSALPALPAGFHYAMWMHELDAAGAAVGDPMHLGDLTGAGDGAMPRTPPTMMPANSGFMLSIEADHGAAGMSPVTCFQTQHNHGG